MLASLHHELGTGQSSVGRERAPWHRVGLMQISLGGSHGKSAWVPPRLTVTRLARWSAGRRRTRLGTGWSVVAGRRHGAVADRGLVLLSLQRRLLLARVGLAGQVASVLAWTAGAWRPLDRSQACACR